MKYEDFEKTGLYLGKLISLQKKSIKLMLEMLLSNENIQLVTNCNLQSQPGVITLTDKRILFTSKVLFTSVKKEVLLENITSFNYDSAFTNKLTITSYNRDVFTITSIDKVVGEKLIQSYNSLKQVKNIPLESISIGISDLEKLAELREKGIITADEFDLKKKQILGL